MPHRQLPESVSSLSERRSGAVNRVDCDIAAVTEPVTILHVNANGFTIETAARLRVGSVHHCRFRIDGHVVSLSARVVESRHRPRSAAHTIALEFRRLGPRDHAAAERLAARVLGPLFADRTAFA